MRNNQIIIKNLVLQPEHTEVVANWIYNEFAKKKGDITLESVVERFRNRNLNIVPLSLIAVEGKNCYGVVSLFKNDLQPRQELSPWLAGLYVDKEYRGFGIAEKLINGVIDVAQNLGYDRIYLRTEHTAEYYKQRGWMFLEDTVDEYGEETSIFYK